MATNNLVPPRQAKIEVAADHDVSKTTFKRQKAVTDLSPDTSMFPLDVNEEPHEDHGASFRQQVSKLSISSCKSNESGYGSQRNSMIEDSDTMIHQTSPTLPKIHEHGDTQETLSDNSDKVDSDSNSNSSIGSSQYATARCSLDCELDTEKSDTSNISPVMDAQVAPEDCKGDFTSNDDLEVDRPHHLKKRAPRLSSSSKSSTIDICPSCKNPIKRMPRRSSTESELSDITLKLCVSRLARKERQLGEDAEVVLIKAVKDNCEDFRDYTDFAMLAVHLHKENLLHPGEKEKLNNPLYTKIDKANYFYLEVLEHKGPDAYRCFYYALREEKKHKGHIDLFNLLEQALDSLV